MTRKRRFYRFLVTCLVMLVFFLGYQRIVYSKGEKEGFSLKSIKTDKKLEEEIVKGVLPALYQSDSRWGKESYGESTIEIAGCGPTCLSMVACGLRGDAVWSPPAVAEYACEEGYYIEGSGTAWALMTEGAADLGLSASEVPLSESRIRQELAMKHPIICVVGPGDFTTEGHYLVLVEETETGKIRIHDPNSRKNTKKEWDLQQLMGQMKNLWSYQLD